MGCDEVISLYRANLSRLGVGPGVDVKDKGAPRQLALVLVPTAMMRFFSSRAKVLCKLPNPLKSPVRSEVVENTLGEPGLDSKQLLQVESLETTVAGLCPNVHRVTDDLHVSTVGGRGMDGQASQIHERPVGENLNKGRSIRLADSTKLTPRGRGPAPYPRISM